jgi:hypothetical protein
VKKVKKVKKILLSLLFVSIFGLQMSAQSILKHDKIPKNLVITLSLGGTVQFADYFTYKITSDGKVVYIEQRNGLPTTNNYVYLLKDHKRVKSPKIKENLSKKQLKSIIKEFEVSGFFEMNEYYQGYTNSSSEELTCVNHAMSKSVSISINGKSKSVGFFLGCGYSEDSPLKRFLNLYDKVSKELETVKKQKVENLEM